MTTNDENFATDLAVMKSQIINLIQSSQRVEALLEKFSMFDKSHGELMQRHLNLNERHIEIEKEVEKCAQSHASETKRLWTEIAILNDKASKAHGIGMGSMAMLGIIASIATYFLTFLFTTVQDNKAALIRQHQQIIQLEKGFERNGTVR